MSYEWILADQPTERLGRVQFNRPQVLNALSAPMLDEVMDAMLTFNADERIGALILTGGDQAFAAGADIKEMDAKTHLDMVMDATRADRFDFTPISKPIVAAVSGYALGGGCEIAMNCDMIVASETAVFGQPEINLGIIPGGGATQRMTRALGKALAMEIMLTDRRLSAAEALRYGLVNRVTPLDEYMNAAIQIASKAASMSQIAVKLTKEAISKADEMTLRQGLEFERRNFYLAFSAEDKTEGMRAFIEKRKAEWKNR